jgi:hypothetical protein
MSMSHLKNRRSLLQAASALLLTADLWPKRIRAGERMSKPIEAVCEAYIKGWASKDLNAIAACVDTKIHFKSPTSETTGKEEYLAATARVLPLLVGFNVRGVFTSGAQAMFAYDFICRPPIGSCPTGELVTVEKGLIRSSEVFFDPRPFIALAQSSPLQNNK